MSIGKTIGYSIAAVIYLGWTWFALNYLFQQTGPLPLPFLAQIPSLAALGINFTQAVGGFTSVWEFNVWVMAVILAFIAVFYGAASGHSKLEPIAAASFLAYTIVSYFIGCSIMTLGLPYRAFGTPSFQATINLAGLFGGGSGSSSAIPAITLNLTLIMVPLTLLAILYASLMFVRTVLKSMKNEYEVPSTPKGTSNAVGKSTTAPGAKNDEESKDFFRNVRMS
jgi:hypothetical protein